MNLSSHASDLSVSAIKVQIQANRSLLIDSPIITPYNYYDTWDGVLIKMFGGPSKSARDKAGGHCDEGQWLFVNVLSENMYTPLLAHDITLILVLYS